MSAQVDMLSSAIEYARRGWAVVPIHTPDPTQKGGCSCHRPACDSPGKHPRTPNGLKDASIDADTIIRWWTKWPAANIGVCTGSRSGGLVVLDVDADRDGPEELQKLPEPLPETPMALTGGGGMHFFFLSIQPVPNSVDLIARGIDVRGEEGYVVAPPSLHRSGRRYAWEASAHPDDVAIATLPECLRELASKKRTQRMASPEDDVAVLKGARNETLFKLASKIRRSGVSGEGILQVLLIENQRRCMPPLDEQEIAKIARSATRYDAEDPYYGGADAAPPTVPSPGATPFTSSEWTSRLMRKPPNKQGVSGPVSCVANAVIVLNREPEWGGVIGWDDFALEVRALKPPPWLSEDCPKGGAAPGAWTDEDDTRVSNWLARMYDIRLSSMQCREAVRVVARANTRHPVREYLSSLKWDGTNRLDHWLVDYFGVEDTEYARCVGRWWLISAVARVFTPGCKADHVLILEGLTGTFKSTAISTLVPRREWFSDTPFVIGDKDGFLSLAGRWIQELAELDSLTRADPARSKAFFSSGIDSYRPPYGRSVVQVPRQCVFVGTVNPSGSGYLVDETGNRRFWPVTCRTLDLPSLAAARDQLWAEATAMYHAGATWWPTPGCSVTAELVEQQDQRYRSDAWEEAIGDWLATPEAKSRLTRNGFITMTDVLFSALSIEKARWSRSDQTRAGICMSRLKWRRERPRVEGSRATVFVPAEPPANQARHRQA